MRIVLDLQGMQTDSRFRGIGRYTLMLAESIVRNRGEHEIILVISGLFPDTIEPIRSIFDGLLPQSNIRVWYAPGPVRECDDGNNLNREAAELIREAFLKNLNPDIIHISSLFEGYVDDAVTSIGRLDQTIPTVVTLYDLIPLQNPEHYLFPIPAYERYYLKKIESLKQAHAFLSISDFTSKDAHKILGIGKDRIFNISSASDPKFKCLKISAEETSKLYQRYGIDRPFVLYTGGGDARKNIHRLLRAYAQLPMQLRTEYRLILAGQLSEEELQLIKEVAKSAGLIKEELIFTGFVPNENLVNLYNLCSLFIFPSWHEGFGLPALEAMSCGAPVIAANSTSLPEIINWAEALFDPFSETAIAAKISQALTDKNFRAKLISNGIQRSKEFSWNECAKKSFAAYEQVYKTNRSNSNLTLTYKRRLKLAYISPLPPQRSGIADYSAELLPELLKYYDIEVIVSQNTVSSLWIKSNCIQRSIEWFKANVSTYDRVLYHFGNSVFHQHMFSLLNEVPGVVVLHDFFLGNIVNYMDSVGYQPNIWIETLYHSHGYSAVKERYNSADIEGVIWKYPCNLNVLQNALGIIVHSASSKNLVTQFFGEKVKSNCNVIPLLRVGAQKFNQAISRKPLDLNSDDFVVSSFGQLGPVKLNHQLLEAWLSSSLAKNPKCILIFVGENQDGEYEKKLLEKIFKSGLHQRIRVTGWVDAETYRKHLEATDICVQLRSLSRGETSAAVLDCMNYGVATVVNATGSMSELPNECVWMLNEDFNNAELTEALEKLFLDSNLRYQLSTKSRSIIFNEHAPKISANKYFEEIEKNYSPSNLHITSLINAIARIDGISEKSEVLMPLAEAIAFSIPSRLLNKQLLLDISVLVYQDLKSGIQRVVRSILNELLNNPPKGYRVEPVYATPSQGYRYARRFTLKFLKCPENDLQDEPIEYKYNDIFLGLDLAPEVVISKSDFYQKLRNCGVKVNFLVYDILPILNPNFFPDGASNQFLDWLKIVSESDGVICISKAVSSELGEWLISNKTNRKRTFENNWFSLGADIENSFPSFGLPYNADKTLADLTGYTNFIMVGTIEPRKGHLQTLEAFTLLWKKGIKINLIIVGREGWNKLPNYMRKNIPTTINKIKSHPELGKRLFWFEEASDEYLEKLYKKSSCLLSASEGEGFGLPLIEAAKHGLPIIARDIPVFREVAGEFAYYFNGKNAEKLSEEIQEWLVLSADGTAPQSLNIKWLTWSESTHQLIKVIT